MQLSQQRQPRGVGLVANEALRDGLTNEEALKRVLAAFPNARTNTCNISWYRMKLRAAGEVVQTSRAIKQARRTRPIGLAGSSAWAHAS